MNSQARNDSSVDETLPEDPSWQRIRTVITELPVRPAGLRDSVVAEIRVASSEAADMESIRPADPAARNRRTVAGTHRLAATVASLTAMLVVSISLSGLLDEPSRHVRVAGAELMASIMNTAEDDWQVVVVTVPESSQARIRDSISTSALRTGMDVHSVDTANARVSSEQPDLFISSADSAATVLSLVDRATGGVDAAEIVDMDRERLLSRFVESMQSPSASEKFFGQMLIVQRDSLELDAKEILQSNGIADEASMNSMSVKKPVLVVLTSKDVATLGTQGGLGTEKLPVALVL